MKAPFELNASTHYLVSIHDVMPETLDRVFEIFGRLEQSGLLPVTLLVVPGRDWRPEDITRLRSLVARGAELAGHGWVHEVERVSGFGHRLHSALISKRVAEHLALDGSGCIELMQRCHDWFADQDLPLPTLYVPPAWAMGPLSRSALHDLPFRQFETLSGVYATGTSRFRRLPLLGFEVDSRWRRLIVHGWNAVNQKWGGSLQRPIRLGIHPHDFSLQLSDQLDLLIRSGGQGLSYRSLV